VCLFSDMMPKMIQCTVFTDRFMRAKCCRHIPETLEYEQTQQDGHENS